MSNTDRLTFLSARRGALVKRISPDKVTNYPLIKRVSSFEHEVPLTPEGLREKLALFQEHAESGHCLFIGQLSRPLANESRKGLGVKMAETNTLTLDIDGLHLPGLNLKKPATADDLKAVSERLVSMLPEAFHDVSYVAHASAKMGMNVDEVRMHIDFWLDQKQQPSVRQTLLKHLNFFSDAFKTQIQLSASGTALKYPIDVCVGQNNRVLFIAHPEFTDVSDPIATHQDRIFLVEKGTHLVSTRVLLTALEDQDLGKLADKKLESLREFNGLPRRFKRSIQTVTDDNGVEHYVSLKPAKLTLTVVADEGDFVRMNINNGDSGAYYVRKNRPEIVWNFKGEQPFSFREADEDAYLSFLNTFPPELKEDKNLTPTDYLKPVVFRDKTADTYFTALIDQRNGGSIKEIHPTGKREVLQDWMQQFGGLMPETVASWDYAFKPQDNRIVDEGDCFVNKFVMPDMLRNLAEIPAELQGVGYDDTHTIKTLCPMVYHVVYSALGNGDVEFKHFINWLAYIIQHRTMTKTAWIMQGVQGTGKGIIFHDILKPIFTQRYAIMKRVEEIEEQFNAWRETAIVCAIDEVKFPSGKDGDKLRNKLKNYISDPSGSVRAMRENQKIVDFYTNFLLFTNEPDAVQIEDSDRRYNVAPRQETALRNQKGGEKIIEAVANGEFAKEIPLFASVLMQMDVDFQKVNLVLDNEAKDIMREAAASSVDEFTAALHDGDLDYFTQVLDMTPGLMGQDHIRAAQNHVKAWIRDFMPGECTKLWISDIRPLYNALVGKCETDRKFGKLLSRQGVNTTQVWRGGLNRRGMEIYWNLKHNTIDALRERYLSGPEMATCPDREAIERHAVATRGETPIH